MTTFPKISIVTPSFNQGRFLEKTILSVIEQDYPNLEYIIIDGGSTDESVEIIKKYEKHLAYWVSEPDRGQSHAINKGFEKATGEIFGWLNSDDWYHPGALKAVAEAFAANPDAGAVVGAGEILIEDSGKVDLVEAFPVTIESLCRSVYGRFFMQPSCFFAERAWRDCGPLDESLQLAMDTDLWLSIAAKYDFALTPANLSVSLVHSDAKTNARASESYADGIFVIMKHGQNGIAREQLVKLLGDLIQEQENYHRLIQDHDDLHREMIMLNDQRKRDIEIFHSSVSWKITAPLRKLCQFIK